MKRLILGWVSLAAGIYAATAVHAQTLVADEIGPSYPPQTVVMMGPGMGPGPYPVAPGDVRGGYVAYDDALRPVEIVRIIRSTGYEPLGLPVRRRWVYTISAINPDGDDGRVVLDARTGRVMRFVPAGVSEDEVTGSYGPPGLPPSLRKTNARTSLRPPMPVPHVASRTPVVATSKPESRPVAAAPPSRQSAVVQTKPAETRPAETKPVVQLRPTQEMPAAQGLY